MHIIKTQTRTQNFVSITRSISQANLNKTSRNRLLKPPFTSIVQSVSWQIGGIKFIGQLDVIRLVSKQKLERSAWFQGSTL
jgi:hypothetical protein